MKQKKHTQPHVLGAMYLEHHHHLLQSVWEKKSSNSQSLQHIRQPTQHHPRFAKSAREQDQSQPQTSSTIQSSYQIFPLGSTRLLSAATPSRATPLQGPSRGLSLSQFCIMGLVGFLESAGLVLGLFAEVGALGCWSLVVLTVGGAMMDVMFLEAVGGKSCEDGKGKMVRGRC